MSLFGLRVAEVQSSAASFPPNEERQTAMTASGRRATDGVSIVNGVGAMSMAMASRRGVF